MSKRRKPPAPGPSIVPAGIPGEFRVQYPSGEYSDVMTLSECREIVRMEALSKTPISYR